MIADAVREVTKRVSNTASQLFGMPYHGCQNSWAFSPQTADDCDIATQPRDVTMAPPCFQKAIATDLTAKWDNVNPIVMTLSAFQNWNARAMKGPYSVALKSNGWVPL